jgi:hypothetical protein
MATYAWKLSILVKMAIFYDMIFEPSIQSEQKKNIYIYIEDEHLVVIWKVLCVCVCVYYKNLAIW